MARELAIEDVARLAAEPLAVLRGWQERGLVSRGGWTLHDVELVRLIRALERRGLPADVIDEAVVQHRDLIDSFLDELTSEDVTIVADVEAAAADAGIPVDVIDRIASAGGLEEARLAPTPDDVAAIASIRTVLQSGFPEHALLQLVRVYADALGRVADAEVRLFHLHVHQAFRASGLDGVELIEATNKLSRDLESLIDPTLLYFHRKAWKRAMRQDFVLHVLEEIGVEVPDATEGRLWRAVLFVDLSSFTPLTNVMGDTTAIEVLDRFARHVREVTHAWGGTVVKQIGDGFMVVFLEARSAIASALELDRRVEDEPQFPAMHAGAHYGPVLYREGDYLGTTVNLAARLVAEAGSCEIIVSADARREAGALDNASFTPLGTRHVKGLDQPVELFGAEATDRPPARRYTDPVCGMRLGEDEIAARITVGSDAYAFCSTVCLTVFASKGAARSTA